MKKYIWIIAIIVILIGGGFLFYYMNNKNNSTNYNAQKSSQNINTNTNTSLSNNQNISNTQSINSNIQSNISNSQSNNSTTTKPATFTEKDIASFSTKITNKKDSNRQQNISITCSTLNGTEIKAGETFSFCNTVGEATAEKGYKEANIIVDGVEKKGLGGGNCQVSSTLYNAVLASPELEVVERHAHSAEVPYIEKGKDAAISYGTHDFKFKNNSDSTVKIYVSNSSDNITVRLVKVVKQ